MDDDPYVCSPCQIPFSLNTASIEFGTKDLSHLKDMADCWGLVTCPINPAHLITNLNECNEVVTTWWLNLLVYQMICYDLVRQADVA